MLLPERCSAKVDGKECQVAPLYVISVQAQEGEYMLAVVCDEHKSRLKARLVAMQKDGKAPLGRINFQPLKAIVTDCVVGMNEDCEKLELMGDLEWDSKTV